MFTITFFRVFQLFHRLFDPWLEQSSYWRPFARHGHDDSQLFPSYVHGESRPTPGRSQRSHQ